MKKAVAITMMLLMPFQVFAGVKEFNIRRHIGKREIKPDVVSIDEKARTFKIKKWNEDTLEIYSNLTAHTNRIYKIKDELFEFEVEMARKPTSNVILFRMRNWEDYDFFYQPPLTPEEIVAGKVRPEEAIGSYAVYHKNKRDGHYQTGKVCHIYRPKYIDAKGNEKWADMEIKNGIIRITVDQKWLDTAEYPIILDPTIGMNTMGASSDNLGNYFFAFAYCAPISGKVSKAYAGVSNTSYSFKMSLYETSGTPNTTSWKPYSPIANTYTGIKNIVAASKPTQISEWTSHTFPAKDVVLTAGTTYWICIEANGGSCYYDSVTDDKSCYFKGGNYYDAFPLDPAPQDGYYGGWRYSFYYEFEELAKMRSLMINSRISGRSEIK